MKFGIVTLFDHYAEDCSEEQYYKNFLNEACYAEELGFDSVWIGEHHFCRYICPAPQIVAAAIAQQTKRFGLVPRLRFSRTTIRFDSRKIMRW